ncbi:hypothetical protein ABIE51_002112 [Lysobacter sp. OAE881]|uniref:hypothetical protein n=1 Tax=Lysobacter sp. OAE881 TaxID=2663813 RepID=UPI00178B6623
MRTTLALALATTMWSQGSPVLNRRPDESLYGGPQDIHTVGRNASTFEPTKFAEFFLRDAGKPAVIPGE